MSPMRIIRRLHAPIVAVVIACVVSVGCRSEQEVLSLDKPAQAYRDVGGSLWFGYRVTPTLKPEHAGWHWLVVEPDTADRLMQPIADDALVAGDRVVVVRHTGWRANARLTPPLLEPGLPDSTPPAGADAELTALRFVWDGDRRGLRLVDAGGAALPLMRVSPDAQTLKVWVYQRDAMDRVLKWTAIAALITGLILLGGSGSIDVN